MEEYIKKEIQRYKELKKIWEIIIDTDHPLNKEVRSQLTLEDINNLAVWIKQREDEGIQLLAYDRN